MFKRKDSVLALDIESTGLSFFHEAEAFALSTCDKYGETNFWEWDVDPYTRKPQIPESHKQSIRKLFFLYGTLVFHHAKFDIRGLAKAGLDLTDRWDDVHDTGPMFHVLDSDGEKALKPLALVHLDFSDDDEKSLGKIVQSCRTKVRNKKLGYRIADETLPGAAGVKSLWKWDYWLPKAMDSTSKALSEYGTNDAIRTMRLFLLGREALATEKLEHLYERERKLIPVIYGMESHGLPTHPRILIAENKRFSAMKLQREKELQRIASRFGMKNFNCQSPDELQKLLYDKLKLPQYKETKTGFSTDADTLQKIWTEHLGNYHEEETNHRETVNECIESKTVDALLFQRKAKAAATYTDQYKNLLITDRSKSLYRLHSSIHQNGTKTTRCSSSSPNSQNMSERSEMPLRSCFGPAPDTFWYDVDYQNLELRLLAFAAGDTRMIELFEKGISIHKVIAEELHGPLGKDYKTDPRYKNTKNGDFSIPYGATETKADATYKVDGAYRKVMQMFPDLAKLLKSVMMDARINGFTYTLFGYRLNVPRNKPYVAVNYKIQGTAGDVLKYAMLNCKDIPDTQMVLTVHDELVFEIPNSKLNDKTILERIKWGMEEPGTRISIPTLVDIKIVRSKWSEGKAIKV